MRTTEAAVLEIMDTELTEIQLTPFLTTANVLVTTKLAGALSDTILAEIEKYLAAHLASFKSKYAIRETVSEASWTTGFKGGEGLSATPYGEMVKLLDTTGIMTQGATKTVGIATVDFALDDDD